MDSMLVITIAAVTVAAIMSLVAWRVVREERRRSEARIAALAADIHGGIPIDRDLPLNHSPVRVMTGVVPEPRRRDLATITGAAILVVGSIAAIFITMTSGPHPVAAGQVSAAATQASSPPAAAASGQPQALELVALTHERDGDLLTVRGTVRNPRRAVGVSHLSAVVLLFNAEGRFLTSGRVQVSAGGLAAGAQAPFVITVSGAGGVGRYRVSFRSDDRVVPHVDRRTS